MVLVWGLSPQTPGLATLDGYFGMLMRSVRKRGKDMKVVNETGQRREGKKAMW